ncbi:MAG: hypothetical protein DI576_05965 [Actinomyces sp.]|nr:MAG: hypothetical protein DI576_05965 [Actinomyces sp.]
MCPPASRSVVFRVEIGRVPRRDRSSSASRSVEFRVEIGPSPDQDHGIAPARGRTGRVGTRAGAAR